jgi:DNA-binding transcriptional LysR family regulator
MFAFPSWVFEMRLKHIEVFNALMSAGSVAGAARLLFISPPAVSKALKMVEDELGFLLFQRVHGRLEATAEAYALYEEVAKIPPQLAALRTLTQHLKTGDGGHLRIATLPALAQFLMPRIVVSLRERGILTGIEIRARHSQDLVPALLLKQADIGVDFDFGHHPAITRTTLINAELVCIAPSDWFAPDKPLTPDVYCSRPSVGYYPGDPVGERIGPYARNNSPAALVDTYAAAAGFARQGLAAAIVDPFTAAEQVGCGIACFRLSERLPLRLSAFTHNSRPTSIADAALHACLQETANRALQAIAL